MVRSRSASVSGTAPFAAPPDLSLASSSVLESLSLAGREGRTSSRPDTPAPAPASFKESATVSIDKGISVVNLQAVFEPQAALDRPPSRVRVLGAPRYWLSTIVSDVERTPPSTTTSRSSLAPLAIPSTPATGRVRSERGSQHPFEADGFTRGLQSAGYLALGADMFDVSRQKIKGRFAHGLAKENFKAHLATFLEKKDAKKRGEYMIRFVGQQDVHSPFVHLYTSALLTNTSTIKIFPSEPDPRDPDGFTLWTHLRTVGNSSHWSAKKNRHWPLRVVFEGPSSTDVVPSALSPTSPTDRSRSRRKGRRGDDDDPLSPATKENTQINSAFVNHPKREVVEPEEPPPPTPTILASVRQLGVAVARTIQPQVQTTIQSLRGWMKGDGDVEDEEEAARRERRRVRRQVRREREEMETRRDRDWEEEVTREEREVRRAERRRRRAQQQ